jgi:hypothetical protein
MTMQAKIIENRVVVAKAGDWIKHPCGRMGKLMASDWDMADFRWPLQADGESRAVNIEITGRTFQRNRRANTSTVKVRIEYVGDGEPSVYVDGLMYVSSQQFPEAY